MEQITVHVDKDNTVVICCPFCGATKKTSVDKFRGVKHIITSRCKCDNRFRIQLNFRKNHRRTVHLSGDFANLTQKISGWQQMNVCNLSQTGSGCKTLKPASINNGDILRIKFNFDTGKNALFMKRAIVKSVRDRFFGCEFLDLAFEEKELGFYLFS